MKLNHILSKFHGSHIFCSWSLHKYLFFVSFLFLGFKNWNILVHIISILDISRSTFTIDFFDFAKVVNLFQKHILHWNYLPSLCLSVPKNFYPKNHWFSLWLELLLNVYDVAIDMANPNMGSQVVLFSHMQLFWLFFFWCAQIKKSKFVRCAHLRNFGFGICENIYICVCNEVFYLIGT